MGGGHLKSDRSYITGPAWACLPAPVSGGSWRMFEAMCVPFVYSQTAQFTGGGFLCLPCVFADEIMHKQIQSVFPNTAISLERIHIFKTSMRAELTVIHVSAATSSHGPSVAALSEVTFPPPAHCPVLFSLEEFPFPKMILHTCMFGFFLSCISNLQEGRCYPLMPHPWPQYSSYYLSQGKHNNKYF